MENRSPNLCAKQANHVAGSPACRRMIQVGSKQPCSMHAQLLYLAGVVLAGGGALARLVVPLIAARVTDGAVRQALVVGAAGVGRLALAGLCLVFCAARVAHGTGRLGLRQGKRGLGCQCGVSVTRKRS